MQSLCNVETHRLLFMCSLQGGPYLPHVIALQEKSYFALRLPHGWWLFGLDLALVDDIDMCQCR